MGQSQIPQLQKVSLIVFRSQVNQNVHQTILRLEGVNDRSAAQYYFGKRVAYIYKTHSGKAENRFRVFLCLVRPSGEEFQQATETLVLCWPDSLLTCQQRQSVQPLELCYSLKEADLILFKHSYSSFIMHHHNIFYYQSTLKMDKDGGLQ